MEEWKKEDRVMLSTRDLVFKERPVCKLMERYVGPYKIEEVVCSETTITAFNENSSGSQCELGHLV